jgi:molecular chaperone HscB
MEDNHCWHCGQAADLSLFCRFCNHLQEPVLDYYRFFGFPRKFHLDTPELERRFYSLSRQLHPDLFFRAMSRERQYSLEATALLNDAYRTLRDPVLRAEYLLQQLGEEPDAQQRDAAPPELLEEVFELNEALEELRQGDASTRPRLEQAHRKFLALRQEADRALDELYCRHDSTGERAVLKDIRVALDRRRYLHNLIQQIEKELAP